MTPEQAAAERRQLFRVVKGSEVAGRVPAHDLDAEAAVLSVVLLDKAALPVVRGGLRAEDFYSPDNRAIYSAALAVHGRGVEVDIVTVNSELRSRNKCNLGRYLNQIVDATPAPANVHAHARIVLDCSRWRALTERLQQALSTCYEPPGDTEEALAEIVADVHRVARRGAPRHAKKLGNAAMAVLSKEAGLSWGIKELDEAMGLLIAPWVYVIMALPGHGKTALASWTALQVAKQGWGVIFFSSDLDSELLAPRMTCALQGIPYEGFSGAREPHKHEVECYIRATAELNSLPLFVDDRRNPSPEAIETSALQVGDRLKREGRELALVVVDQLQTAGLVEGPVAERWTDAQKLRMTMRAYVGMAKRLAVPLICLSQLSQSADGPYPYGSKAVAQEVDNIGAIKTKGEEMHLDMTSQLCKRRAGRRQDGCWRWYPDTQGF